LVREAAKDLILLPHNKRDIVKLLSVIGLCVILLTSYFIAGLKLPMELKFAQQRASEFVQPVVKTYPEDKFEPEVKSDLVLKWQLFLTAHGLLNYLQIVPIPNVDAINQLRNKLLQETDVKLALISTVSSTTCAGQPIYDWQDGLKLVIYHSQLSGTPLLFFKVTDDTRIVQNILVAQGLMSAMTVDGIMGPITQQALIAFQQRSGRAITGQVDDGTAYALSCAIRPNVL